MNERIKELIKQAQIDDIAFDKWGDAYDVKRLDPEKFAELIVRECAGVNYNSAFKDGEFCAREVLEHFGVEE